MNHNSYITVKRAKFKTISGEVNIPYGTKLEVGGNVLLHNGKPVCAVFSDCAYESFAQNDKCSDRDDFWLWNHDFYNAEIEDLKHIAKLIGAKEVK